MRKWSLSPEEIPLPFPFPSQSLFSTSSHPTHSQHTSPLQKIQKGAFLWHVQGVHVIAEMGDGQSLGEIRQGAYLSAAIIVAL